MHDTRPAVNSRSSLAPRRCRGSRCCHVARSNIVGTTLHAFDLDVALACHPTLILVDELAHTNAPGARHPKCWQDVE